MLYSILWRAESESDSDALRNRFLIGVGCSLFLTSLVAATMIIGLGNSTSGRLKYLLVTLEEGDNVFNKRNEVSPNANKAADPNKESDPKLPAADKESSGKPDSAITEIDRHKMEAVTIQFVFAVAIAVGGVLFFVANKMRKEKEDGVDFDKEEFWPNLWFRIGEVILFTLVLFIVFVLANSPVLLPIAAVLTGMFVTSGEKLMQNLSLRIFSAIEALVPIGSRPSATAPKVTSNLRVANNKVNVVIQFDQPDLQSNYDADVAFIVDYSVDDSSWNEIGTFAKTKFSFDIPSDQRPMKFKVTPSNSRSLGDEHLFSLGADGAITKHSA